MQIETMIEQLLARFGDSAIEQAVWLDTERTCDIYELNRSEIERLYYRFFPRPKTDLEVLVELLAERELKRLRSVVLADAQYMGIYTPSNWTTFNRFMQEHSVFKKGLNQHSKAELEVLIKQFKTMRGKYEVRKYQALTPEWYHAMGLPVPSKN